MRLSDFQDAFASAVLAAPSPAGATGAARTPLHEPLAALRVQPGFAVYRNTVLKGCIDALQANYPAVCRLVGEDWFRAAAAAFVRSHPPTDGRLMDYGQPFGDFLATFEPALGLPYLPDVARWDRRWTQCHLAADAPVLDAHWLAQQPAEALAAIVLQPHPAARWAWCGDHPAFALWQCQREGRAWDNSSAWQPDGGLLTRPQAAVAWHPLTRGVVAFLDACAAARPLAEAAAAAAAADSRTDFFALMQLLLQAGALTQAEHPTPLQETP